MFSQFGPEGRGPGGRRRGRAIDGGELQLLLLSLLADGPRHGYDLIRAIEEISGGAYAPSAGMVYPALTYMVDAGWIIIASEEGSKKSLLATDAGREKLVADAAALAAKEQRLAALAERAARTDVQPVRRAMHNLRSALMARLSVDDLPLETQHRIVDIIDDAARQIERIA